MSKDLTPKQNNALVNLVSNGGNATQAMLDAGYSEKTAHTPSKLTKSPKFKLALQSYNQQLATKYELTLEEAYRLIQEAKNAKKVVVHNGANPDDSWTEEVPDYTTRLKVADRIMKIHELETPTKVAQEQSLSTNLQYAYEKAGEITLNQVKINRNQPEKTSS